MLQYMEYGLIYAGGVIRCERHRCKHWKVAMPVEAPGHSAPVHTPLCSLAHQDACVYVEFRDGLCTQAEYLRALKGVARASHSGEIALSGSRRLRSTLVAAPVLFAHAVVTVKNRASTTPR
jgi:hypothetical protein